MYLDASPENLFKLALETMSMGTFWEGCEQRQQNHSGFKGQQGDLVEVYSRDL
jgi:hypothetical protein